MRETIHHLRARVPTSFLLLVGVLFIFGLVSRFSAQDPSRTGQAPTSASGAFRVKVDVDLVLVTATVTDRSNRFVPGLEREHFQIFEDKVEQKISQFSTEEMPVSIGLLFDVSSSMAKTLSRAKDAASAFLKTTNPEDEFFLLTFADQPKVEQEFTSDLIDIENHLAFAPAKGSTTLYDAVYVGLEKIKHGHNAKRALLLITDGEDTGSRHSLRNVRNAAKESDTQIYAIGIDTDSFFPSTGWLVLEEMAEITGGSAYFPDSVNDLEDIYIKIALELRNQYVLGYSSTNPTKDGRWRKIKVKLNPPKSLRKLSVRSRTGYYAPSG